MAAVRKNRIISNGYIFYTLKMAFITIKRRLFFICGVFLWLSCGLGRAQVLPSGVYRITGKPSIFYRLQAAAGKPVLVFVHGSPGDGNDFSKYLSDSLLAHHYEIATVDRPGFGQTGGPSMPSLAAQAAAVAAVLQRFAGRPICIVGHSYGGPLAVQLALDYPALVHGLVLLAPALDPELEKQEWQRPLIKSRFGRWLLPMAIQNSNAELMTLQADLFVQRARLKALHVPVVHIHGSWDMFVDADNLLYTKKHFTNLPYFKQLKLQHVNHFIPWTQFKLVRTELLKFGPHFAQGS